LENETIEDTTQKIPIPATLMTMEAVGNRDEYKQMPEKATILLSLLNYFMSNNLQF